MLVLIDRRFFRTPLGIASVLVTIGVVAWLIFMSLQPLPRRTLTIAAGNPQSGYYRYAERYRAILARDRIRLRIITTEGAVENARLLMDAKSGVDVGFVQAGTLDAIKAPNLESLGTIFYEAVWFYCTCTDLASVRVHSASLRLSIGPEGSADRPLALKLLRLNGFDPAAMKLFAYRRDEAAEALLQNKIDGIIMLASTESAAMQRLAQAPQVKLLSFARASAYVALDPTLSELTVPRGVFNLVTDRPSQDTTVVGSKASLAIRTSLHPALQYLLLEAISEVHSKAGMFNRGGEFPAPEVIDLPVSKGTRNFYRTGPTILRRTLPFWLAVLVERLAIILLPLAGILLPMWTVVIRLYQWTNRRNVLAKYRELRQIEREIRRTPAGERSALLTRLDQLDQRVLDMRMPVAMGDITYNLRSQILSLRSRS